MGDGYKECAICNEQIHCAEEYRHVHTACLSVADQQRQRDVQQARELAYCDMEKARQECRFIAAATHDGLREFSEGADDNIARCFQAQAEALEQARTALEEVLAASPKFNRDHHPTLAHAIDSAKSALARFAALTGRK